MYSKSFSIVFLIALFSIISFISFASAANQTNQTNQTSPSVPGAAPTNLTNSCPNHIAYVCPSFNNPQNQSYTSYNISLYLRGKLINSTITKNTYTKFTGLQPSSKYNVTVFGISANGTNSSSATSTFATRAADPKYNPALGITNLQCMQIVGKANYRKNVTCTFNQGPTYPTRINVKFHCRRELDANRRAVHGRTYTHSYVGAAANLTQFYVPVFRHSVTCYLRMKPFYQYRAGRVLRYKVELI